MASDRTLIPICLSSPVSLTVHGWKLEDYFDGASEGASGEKEGRGDDEPRTKFVAVGTPFKVEWKSLTRAAESGDFIGLYPLQPTANSKFVLYPIEKELSKKYSDYVYVPTDQRGKKEGTIEWKASTVGMYVLRYVSSNSELLGQVGPIQVDLHRTIVYRTLCEVYNSSPEQAGMLSLRLWHCLLMDHVNQSGGGPAHAKAWKSADEAMSWVTRQQQPQSAPWEGPWLGVLERVLKEQRPLASGESSGLGSPSTTDSTSDLKPAIPDFWSQKPILGDRTSSSNAIGGAGAATADSGVEKENAEESAQDVAEEADPDDLIFSDDFDPSLSLSGYDGRCVISMLVESGKNHQRVLLDTNTPIIDTTIGDGETDEKADDKNKKPRPSQGLNVLVLNRKNMSVVFSAHYDTHGNPEKAEQMAGNLAHLIEKSRALLVQESGKYGGESMQALSSFPLLFIVTSEGSWETRFRSMNLCQLLESLGGNGPKLRKISSSASSWTGVESGSRYSLVGMPEMPSSTLVTPNGRDLYVGPSKGKTRSKSQSKRAKTPVPPEPVAKLNDSHASGTSLGDEVSAEHGLESTGVEHRDSKTVGKLCMPAQEGGWAVQFVFNFVHQMWMPVAFIQPTQESTDSKAPPKIEDGPGEQPLYQFRFWPFQSILTQNDVDIRYQQAVFLIYLYRKKCDILRRCAINKETLQAFLAILSDTKLRAAVSASARKNRNEGGTDMEDSDEHRPIHLTASEYSTLYSGGLQSDAMDDDTEMRDSSHLPFDPAELEDDDDLAEDMEGNRLTASMVDTEELRSHSIVHSVSLARAVVWALAELAECTGNLPLLSASIDLHKLVYGWYSHNDTLLRCEVSRLMCTMVLGLQLKALDCALLVRWTSYPFPVHRDVQQCLLQSLFEYVNQLDSSEHAYVQFRRKLIEGDVVSQLVQCILMHRNGEIPEDAVYQRPQIPRALWTHALRILLRLIVREPTFADAYISTSSTAEKARSIRQSAFWSEINSYNSHYINNAAPELFRKGVLHALCYALWVLISNDSEVQPADIGVYTEAEIDTQSAPSAPFMEEDDVPKYGAMNTTIHASGPVSAHSTPLTRKPDGFRDPILLAHVVAALGQLCGTPMFRCRMDFVASGYNEKHIPVYGISLDRLHFDPAKCAVFSQEDKMFPVLISSYETLTSKKLLKKTRKERKKAAATAAKAEKSTSTDGSGATGKEASSAAAAADCPEKEEEYFELDGEVVAALGCDGDDCDSESSHSSPAIDTKENGNSGGYVLIVPDLPQNAKISNVCSLLSRINELIRTSLKCRISMIVLNIPDPCDFMNRFLYLSLFLENLPDFMGVPVFFTHTNDLTPLLQMPTVSTTSGGRLSVSEDGNSGSTSRRVSVEVPSGDDTPSEDSAKDGEKDAEPVKDAKAKAVEKPKVEVPAAQKCISQTTLRCKVSCDSLESMYQYNHRNSRIGKVSESSEAAFVSEKPSNGVSIAEIDREDDDANSFSEYLESNRMKVYRLFGDWLGCIAWPRSLVPTSENTDINIPSGSPERDLVAVLARWALGQLGIQPVLQRQERCPYNADRPLRILTLDGGGVRGLVTVEILAKLEEVSGCKLNQLFDFIGGTSTGGILACMIGIQHHTADAMRDVYLRLSGDIFSSSMSWVKTAKALFTTAKYDSKKLVQFIKNAVSQDAKLCGTIGSSIPLPETDTKDASPAPEDPTSGPHKMVDVVRSPHVFICSTLMNAAPPLPFVWRNYEYHPSSLETSRNSQLHMRSGRWSRYPGTSNACVWEAIRASTAAPSVFEEHSGEHGRHVDGGVLVNNPTAIAVHEAQCLYPECNSHVIVSIGTGTPPVKYTSENAAGWGDIMNVLLESATNARYVHDTVVDFGSFETIAGSTTSPVLSPKRTRLEGSGSAAAGHRSAGRKYYRLNPVHEIYELELDTADPQRLAEIQVKAREYVEENIHVIHEIIAMLRR